MRRRVGAWAYEVWLGERVSGRALGCVHARVRAPARERGHTECGHCRWVARAAKAQGLAPAVSAKEADK